jgi:hypothetical protein
MSTVIRGANTKGSYYGDASYRTAYIRKQAIISGQAQKTGNVATSMSGVAQSTKPLISEHHLTNGFTNGVQEFILIKNRSGIF